MVEIGRLDQAIVLVYFMGMLAIGALLAKRNYSFDQFVMAGRSLGAPLLICTLVSTYYGLGVLLAGSEISYESGVVNWFFDTAPAYVLVLVAAFLVAGKVRSRNFRSVPDIVEAHFGLPARLASAVACFVYALPAFSIMGMGGLFHLLFGIPFAWGLWLGSAIALGYTVLGGLLAVALTDAVQFLLMAVTLSAAAWIGLEHLGGVETLEARLPMHFEPTGGRPLALLWVYGMTSLSILVEPAFYQRILAATSSRAIIVAMLAGVLIWMSYDWVITILGIGARLADIDGLMAAPSGPDQAVTAFALHWLPVGLKGLFAAGLMAAAMSTVDSYLLISSSNIVYDIWNPLAGYRMDDTTLVRRTRYTMLFSTLVNIAICFYFGNVERLWIFITAILICTVLVPVMAAFYWPAVKRTAGACAAVVGLGAVLVYYAWVDLLGEWIEAEAAYIWQGRIWGWEVVLNQDYGILYILPLVIMVFLTVQLWPGGRQ